MDETDCKGLFSQDLNGLLDLMILENEKVLEECESIDQHLDKIK